MLTHNNPLFCSWQYICYNGSLQQLKVRQMNIDELRADLLKPKLKPSAGTAKPNVLTALVNALELQDSSELSHVLKTTPNNKLKKVLVDSKVLVALVDNYTQDAHAQLLNKGFDLSDFPEKLLFTHIDSAGWNNLLANTPKPKAFTQWLRALFQESLDYDFERLYPMCKPNAAEFRMVLHQHDPVLHDQELTVFFHNSGGAEGLIPEGQTQLNNHSKQEWAWFKTIGKQSWFDAFQHGFDIENTNLNLFLNFFGELPLAKQALDDIYTQAQNNKQYCMDLLKSSASDITATHLWKKLDGAEQNALQKELKRVAKPLQQLGFSDQELFLYGDISTKLLNKIEQSFPQTQRKSLQYLTNSDVVLTQSVSFVHFLMGTAEVETLAQLSKSPKACEKAQEALSDPMILRSFARATDASHYKKIFKMFPQLATWRDQHNNTLLHYSLTMRRNFDFESNCVLEIITSHPQLRDSNNSGVSLRDMCHMANSKLLADYDKKTMTLALKSAGLNNKMKTAKRKI